MEIKRDLKNHLISIDQTPYIDALLDGFSMKNSNPVATPMDPSVDLAAGQGEPVATNPNQTHWTAVKCVFWYLKGTCEYALTFGGPGDWDSIIKSFTDADWASNDDHKSISGYVFILASGAISWSTKKQPIVALSSTESKYIASTHALKHLIWLRRLFSEIGAPQPTPSILFMDNQLAMSLALDDKFHVCTKHIDIRYHFIHDVVNSGILSLRYCATEDMAADIMTKGLARLPHAALPRARRHSRLRGSVEF